jgi:hypothetical protein
MKETNLYLKRSGHRAMLIHIAEVSGEGFPGNQYPAFHQREMVSLIHTAALYSMEKEIGVMEQISSIKPHLWQ